VALGRPWPEDERYGDYLRGLDGNDPAALAVMQAAASLFRGAGYTCFDGVLPRETGQAAIGAPYAHVTAPLRRLVDRWGLAICEALASGREAPGWARDSLDTLPAIMAESGRRISALESGSIDRVEAALLAGRVGDAFDAIVLSRGKASARIQLADPVVTATVEGSDARPGQAVRVRLTAADIGTGKVAFAPVPGS
jgi:exoribonuclease R